MDGQKLSENYFESGDAVSEEEQSQRLQDTPATTDSMVTVDEDMTVFPYVPPSDASSHSTPQVALAPFDMDAVDHLHSTLQPGPEWQPSTVALTDHQPLAPFDFQQPYDAGPLAHHPEEQPVLFNNSYAAPQVPTAAAPQLGYPYMWNIDNTMSLQPGALGYQPTGPGSSINVAMGPTATSSVGSMGPSAPESLSTKQGGGPPYPSQTAVDMPSYAAEASPAGNETSPVLGGARTTSSHTQAKRLKTTPKSPMAPPTVAGSSKGPARLAGSKSRTMAAQRATRSAIVAAGSSAETPENPKTHSTHNLVEKQYRNRLNAQFDGLMNALPEALRAQSGAGVEYGDGTNADAADKRISKAEVLDMARRHIQNLEQERDLLAHERDQLQQTVARLKEDYAQRGAGQDKKGGGA